MLILSNNSIIIIRGMISGYVASWVNNIKQIYVQEATWLPAIKKQTINTIINSLRGLLEKRFLRVLSGHKWFVAWRAYMQLGNCMSTPNTLTCWVSYFASYNIVEVVNWTDESLELSIDNCMTYINNLRPASKGWHHSTISRMLLDWLRGCKNAFVVCIATLFKNEKTRGRTFISANRPHQRVAHIVSMAVAEEKHIVPRGKPHPRQRQQR